MYNRAKRIVDWLDWVFDCIPSYEDGRWYRRGGWGCRMQLLARFLNRFEKRN